MEWTAREDLKHRLWTLRRSIDQYLALQSEQIAVFQAIRPESRGFTQEQQRVNSQADAAIDSLLIDANNLRRALRSSHLPSSLRGRSLGALDAPIRHLRNIREHWDENRDFWSTGKAIPPGAKYASVRWYKDRFPDKTPWGASWSNVHGTVVGGILPLDELSRILDELESTPSRA